MSRDPARGPVQDPATQPDAETEPAGRGGASITEPALQRRVTALEVENAQLRHELAELTSAHESARHRPSYMNLGDTIRRFQDLLVRAGCVIAEVDLDGRFEGASDSLRGVLGYEPDAVAGNDVMPFIHEEDREAARNLFAGVGGDQRSQQQMLRLRHRDGRWLWFDVDVASREDQQGTQHPLVFIRDVTEIRHALDALRESEDRYRALAENAVDLIVEVDMEGQLHYVSPNVKEILGTPAEQLVGRSLADLLQNDRVRPEDRDALLRSFREQAADDGEERTRSFRLKRADGRTQTFESKMRVYRGSDGKQHAVVIARDISERVAAQEKIAGLEERYRILGEASRDVITESGPDGNLVYVSETMSELLGYRPEELVGTRGAELIHDEDRQEILRRYRAYLEDGEGVFTAHYRCVAKDGTAIWCEGSSVGYTRSDGTGPYNIGMLRDIREQRRMEEEQRTLEERVQRAARLESLGVMAGGIAHDFNNLLTPILGQASLALMDLPDEHPARDRLERVRAGARRAAELTNQMLAYAGAGPLQFEPVDLSELVREMARLLESAVSGRAVIGFELAEGLPRVEADSGQLSQVVMNLITNAVEAVGEGRGEISLRTYLLPGHAVERRNLVVGNIIDDRSYVCFEVEDSGCGMNEQVRARIFDPFFTQKFTGRGLGLAAVLGIIQSHDGAIELRSEAEVGTRFRVLLPPQLGPDAAVLDAAAEVERGLRGAALVVDDDEAVRDLLRDTLLRLGLRVLTAPQGREAIQCFREHADELEIVLLDRTMPIVSGEQVYQEMRRLRPSVPIVLISGYSQERAAEGLGSLALDGFLKKPFSPEELMATVRRLIEA